MKLIDLGNEIGQVNMVPAQAVTATGALGNKIDLQGYQGKVKIIMTLGAIAGTTPTLDIKVQGSSDNNTFADLATPVAFAQKVTGSANSVDAIVVDTRAVPRYLQLYGTVGGTGSPSFTVGYILIGQKQTI